jgi:Uma2 family endonuclease
MSTARQLRYSYEDYLRSLERSELKLEFCAGVIYAMAGGTPAHAELGATAIALLRQALLGRCTVYSSDAKVRVETTDFSAFPDVSVVCGERRVSPVDGNALINPSLLVEVTSRSTEDYDRGEKLSHYQRLPSVNAVLFISHRERRVTVVERAERGWTERELGPGDRVTLSQPAMSLAVDELYAGVTLEPR